MRAAALVALLLGLALVTQAAARSPVPPRKDVLVGSIGESDPSPAVNIAQIVKGKGPPISTIVKGTTEGPATSQIVGKPGTSEIVVPEKDAPLHAAIYGGATEDSELDSEVPMSTEEDMIEPEIAVEEPVEVQTIEPVIDEESANSESFEDATTQTENFAPEQQQMEEVAGSLRSLVSSLFGIPDLNESPASTLDAEPEQTITRFPGGFMIVRRIRSGRDEDDSSSSNVEYADQAVQTEDDEASNVVEADVVNSDPAGFDMEPQTTEPFVGGGYGRSPLASLFSSFFGPPPPPPRPFLMRGMFDDSHHSEEQAGEGDDDFMPLRRQEHIHFDAMMGPRRGCQKHRHMRMPLLARLRNFFEGPEPTLMPLPPLPPMFDSPPGFFMDGARHARFEQNAFGPPADDPFFRSMLDNSQPDFPMAESVVEPSEPMSLPPMGADGMPVPTQALRDEPVFVNVRSMGHRHGGRDGRDGNSGGDADPTQGPTDPTDPNMPPPEPTDPNMPPPPTGEPGDNDGGGHHGGKHKAGRWMKKHKVVVGLIAGAVLLALIALIVCVMRRRRASHAAAMQQASPSMNMPVMSTANSYVGIPPSPSQAQFTQLPPGHPYASAQVQLQPVQQRPIYVQAYAAPASMQQPFLANQQQVWA